MHDVNFSMRMSKATPKLFLACASGQHIKEATLTCRKAGKDPQEYLKIKFSDFLVSKHQTGGSSGEVVPLEQVSFNFSKIEFSYAPQKADGTLDSPVVHNFDVTKNKGG
jgi:type VI secretion system secreted protein Hcp